MTLLLHTIFWLDVKIYWGVSAFIEDYFPVLRLRLIRATLARPERGKAYVNLAIKILRALFNFAARQYEDNSGLSFHRKSGYPCLCFKAFNEP
ncbi:hypothetical protein [Legionella sp. WA2024007413]